MERQSSDKAAAQDRGGSATYRPASSTSNVLHDKGTEDEHSFVSHSSEGLWLRPGWVQNRATITMLPQSSTKPAPTAASPCLISPPSPWPSPLPAPSRFSPHSPVCAWCAASSRGCRPWRRRTAAGDEPRCRASRVRRTSCCRWKAAGTAPCSAARAASCPG